MVIQLVDILGPIATKQANQYWSPNMAIGYRNRSFAELELEDTISSQCTSLTKGGFSVRTSKK